MKLIYRLNLSIGLLLLCILAITAALIYPLLLDTLVDGERKEMREQGSKLMQLTVPTIPAEKLTPSIPVGNWPKDAILTGKMEAILITPSKKVVYSTMSDEQAAALVDQLKQQSAADGFWQGADDKYIVETLSPPLLDQNSEVMQGITTIMATPLSEVRTLQFDLFQRMLVILLIGGLLTFLMSMYITKRLVTPLGKLRTELKKVENRRFSEVKVVETKGEIGEVARSVYVLAGELQRFQDAQKQFFQNASHELKTPLMSIQGYAEGIKDGIFTGERADKGLDVIANECERLKKIVTEMILLAKLESEEGIFRMEDVPVGELIRETAERVKPMLVKRGLRLDILITDSEMVIRADREKLLQALLNIAGNATRHARTTIRLRASANEQGIKLEVTDDGDGIPDELLPRLFQRFAKGSNGETGLGLAISRAIVERCRGRIAASNGQEGGVTFVMSFPPFRHPSD
ncbi:HAMP domain-containing sensor histidine kinase [Paenibacillus sp. LHD-117]|uniref:sensor histidine kinase n=1 Tax=Paenibacillus sp. LHD-117 TaxID=3071412 RepID=UPI0027E12277|nr:HAMP domain-containing sensor histidine kinase [Paenibacillus sp. LHD-117]MDQ6420616.1 HAMP domain-containing sensor histidine kinase [Paenibacillus sp. LHD-117]